MKLSKQLLTAVKLSVKESAMGTDVADNDVY